MLRSKHLGPLSQSARSFFLNGSRCNAGDGSSCSCSSEDDTCISRRPLRATVQQSQLQATSSSLLSKASVGVAPLSSVDSLKELNAKKIENGPLPQGIAAPHTLNRGETVSYGDCIDATPHIAYNLVKAGMAAVGLLSDLVNYRIPMTEIWRN